jgi:hypothetical protein
MKTAERPHAALPCVLAAALACEIGHKVGDIEGEPGLSMTSVGTTATDGGSSGTTTTTSGAGEESSTAATTTIATGEDATAGSEGSTGVEDPVEACGVVVEPGDIVNTWLCDCRGCDVKRHDITNATGEQMLAACECICTAAGCGGSLSTGGMLGDDTGLGTSESTSTSGEGSSSGSSSSG